MSVLMPVRNAERFVDEAIASIVEQTFVDWELILIDDASTDGSERRLARWCERDTRIRIAKNAVHTGLAGSLNRGGGLARSGLIARMDADDVCVPERLAAQIAHFEAHPNLVLCGTAAQVTDVAGNPLRVFTPPSDDRAIRRFLLWDNPFVHSSVMYRRSAFRAAGGYSPRFLHEDYELWVRMAPLGELRNLPDPLLQRREHSSSWSSSLRPLRARLQRLRVQLRAARSLATSRGRYA